MMVADRSQMALRPGAARASPARPLLQSEDAPMPTTPPTPPPSPPPLAADDRSDEEEEEEFQDATAEPVYDLDLKSAFKDCKLAIRRFFNNDVEGAMEIMKPWCKVSLYHSLGTAIFEFIPAVLTFDQGQIAKALDALKTCIALCNRHRRNITMVENLNNFLNRTNYHLYSELEAHAELCYAEALLLQALLTVMEGEDLAGLIRGTLKVKTCYASYKDCAKILDRKEWESAESRMHFQSGVRLGIGTFNVMISMLPPRIVTLLEFVGFSGNKALGLQELKAGGQEPGIRSTLCDLSLLTYHLAICHFTGAYSDLTLCSHILNKELLIFPEGVWFLILYARYELLHGSLQDATKTYQRAVETEEIWPQIRHVCYWDMMWIKAIAQEWRSAAKYADKLIDESSWSRTIYTYTKAAILMEVDDLMGFERRAIDDLFRTAGHYKQRIAGKSLPMEKFMIRRCERYRAQGGRLLLPAVELLALWNMFPILANNERTAQLALKLIDKTRKQIESESNEWMGVYEADNHALIRFLQGTLLACMKLPRVAIETLRTVLKLKNDIVEDTFLLPYSMTEMAMCHHALGEKAKAERLLIDARKKYSGYALESRLHFRLHSKMQIVKGPHGR